MVKYFLTRRSLILKSLAFLPISFLNADIFRLFTNVYRVIIVNYSYLPKTPQVPSTDHFWSQNKDPFSEELNIKFISDGRLLKVDSYLIEGIQAVVLVKYYRSKEDHLEYVRQLQTHHNLIGFHKKVSSKVLFCQNT